MLDYVSCQLVEAHLDKKVARLIEKENLALEIVPALWIGPLQDKVARRAVFHGSREHRVKQIAISCLATWGAKAFRILSV